MHLPWARGGGGQAGWGRETETESARGWVLTCHGEVRSLSGWGWRSRTGPTAGLAAPAVGRLPQQCALHTGWAGARQHRGSENPQSLGLPGPRTPGPLAPFPGPVFCSRPPDLRRSGDASFWVTFPATEDNPKTPKCASCAHLRVRSLQAHHTLICALAWRRGAARAPNSSLGPAPQALLWWPGVEAGPLLLGLSPAQPLVRETPLPGHHSHSPEVRTGHLKSWAQAGICLPACPASIQKQGHVCPAVTAQQLSHLGTMPAGRT